MILNHHRAWLREASCLGEYVLGTTYGVHSSNIQRNKYVNKSSDDTERNPEIAPARLVRIESRGRVT
jgi:hypothetical protein